MRTPLSHGLFHPPAKAQRLSIYIGESDRWQGKPLYEQVVLKARELHLAGATVLRGPMGFGADSRIHTAKILRLSEDLPIVVQIIDTQPNVSLLLAELEKMIGGGLVTIEEVGVAIYNPSSKPPA